MVDECSTAESLLLCAAAIANVSAQHRALVDNLYQHNATARLIAALKRPGCDTVFVHEQVCISLFVGTLYVEKTHIPRMISMHNNVPMVLQNVPHNLDFANRS